MPVVHLVPGRSCGECNACCAYYAIADLNKPARSLCQHWKTPGGCSIYDTRPQVCRDYYCVWLQNATLDDWWRPDRSGFILRETHSDIPAHYIRRVGVVFELCGPDSAIEDDRFIQAVAGQVAQRAPVFLSIMDPQTGTRHVFLNDRMQAAVATRTREPMLRVLRDALAGLRAP